MGEACRRALAKIKPMALVDDPVKKTRHGIAGIGRKIGKRTRKAPGLHARQFMREVMSSRREIEKTLAAILGPGALVNEAGTDKFLENSRQTLLCDIKDFQQFGHSESLMAVDEMQDAMMCTAKRMLGKKPVRLSHEITVGKKEQLDQLEIRRWLVGYRFFFQHDPEFQRL